MNADGKIIKVDENEPGMYSDEMVRFSPRQVTLEPGQSQTVRLLLRKKLSFGTKMLPSVLALRVFGQPRRE